MSKLSREEFESILEECFIEGYNSALEDIQEDIYNEGVVTDIKDYIHHRLDDDEIEEATNEFLKVKNSMKEPEVHIEWDGFFNKGSKNIKLVTSKINKFHILDKNSIATFLIKSPLLNKRYMKSDDKKNFRKKVLDYIHTLVDKLNSKSKKFVFKVHKTFVDSDNIIAPSFDLEGEIFAYRKTDKVKHKHSWKGSRITDIISGFPNNSL